LKDFEPFFGGDEKGAFLVQAMFNGTNYTDRVGQNSGLMTELLRADNYKNYQNIRSATNGQSQSSDDVPQDITDLIITTALFHKSIDLSSTAGTNLGEAINRISTSMNEWLNMKTSGTPSASVKATASIGSSVMLGATYGNVINADRILFFMADRAAWDANHFGTNNNLSTYNDSNNVSTNAAIDTMVKCTGSTASNLCWGSVLRGSESAKLALDQIKKSGGSTDDIIKGIELAIKGDIASIIKDMKQEFIRSYNNINIPSLRQNQTTKANTSSTLGEFSVNTVKNFMSTERKNYYLEMLKNLTNASISKAIRTVVNSTFTILHTDLTNADAKMFFDKVYKAWPTMSPDIKLFYGQNISIFAKTNSTGLYDYNNNQYRKQQLQMDWLRLTPKELDTLFARTNALTNTELSKLRVNLMKSPTSGYNDILFGSNLPDISAGANVWYTHSNGSYGHVTAPPTDFLRMLYKSVYSNGVAGNNIKVTYPAPTAGTAAGPYTLTNVEGNIANRPKQQFNLNIGKFTSASIKREDAEMDAQMRGTRGTSGDVGDDLGVYSFITAYDMAYGKIWTFDVAKGQYFRTDGNGRKVYYDDDAKGDTNTCYATYLAKDDDGKCLRVIQCIADGNSKSLNRCLDVIGDGDLWSVAASDVQKVGPDMVKLVLRKFGVKGYEETDSNGNKYKVPMTYEEWKSTIVSAFPNDVRDTILNNAKLNTYLRGLIGVCRSNPNIINKNNPSIIDRDTTPIYIRNLNMRKYKIPAVSKKSQYEFFSEMLRNAVQPHVVTQDMFNPITSGSFSNVMFVNPYTSTVPTMMGGGFYSANGGGGGTTLYAANVPTLITTGTGSLDSQSQQILRNGSSSMFANMMTTLQNANLDVGLQLHPEDQTRIINVIGKFASYEDQLARLFSVLINIVKLARFYGVSLENVDRDHPTVMVKLSELQSIDDIREFIRGHARELTKNMVSNMSIQQSASYELMNKVAPRLIDDCTGKSSSVATQGTSRQLVAI
jgi:hypothetical protein